MRIRSASIHSWNALLGVAVFGLTAAAVQAQAPVAVDAPTNPAPATTTPPPFRPLSPSCCSPCPGYMPAPGSVPNTGMGTDTGTGTGTTPSDSSAFRSVTSGAGFGSTTAVAPGAYLDSAIPQSMIKLRYDGEFGTNRFDRAEYMYGAWQELAFHAHGIRGQDGSFQGTFFDPKARGAEQFPGELNAEVATAAIEYAFKDTNNRLSAFIAVPVRFLNYTDLLEEPDRERMPGGGFYSEPRAENTAAPNNDPNGLADIEFGFKYALIADPDQYLTFQGRIYAPTGDASRGLGTGHWSLEPSLLYYQRLSDRIDLQAQLTDWIPVAAGPEAGNVLQYGVGVGYTVYDHCNLRVEPVVEVVGWTVLSGLESIALPSGEVGAIPVPTGVIVPTSHGVQDAAGDTIVNVKMGVRTYFGHGQDFYVGYGRAITGDRWYQDIVTAEYRFSF